MASLKQAGKVLTTELGERVEQLTSAIGDDGQDFAEISRLAQAVGDAAELIGATYSDLEQTLIRLVQGDTGAEGEDEEADGSQQARAAEDDSTAEDVTKEELLGRAREAHIEGRSSMSKDELAQAIDAEESLTKEELLERARDAEIEGRSSMTKDELRRALQEARA